MVESGEDAACGEPMPGVYTSFQCEPFIPDCTLPAGHEENHCHHHRILKGNTIRWPRVEVSGRTRDGFGQDGET